MPTSIAIGSRYFQLVAMPPTPGFAELSVTMTDTVAEVMSPFTMWTQTQAWQGADRWMAQVRLPPMTARQAAPWRAWLAELRGKLNVFQLGDPRNQKPLGSGAGVPVANGGSSTINSAGSTVLNSRGWTTNAFRLLLPGDYLQIGYRLHMVCEQVNSDSAGSASIQIWPTLREQLTDGQAIALRAPVGLFRLSKNDRGWSDSPSTQTMISFSAEEVR